MTHETWLPIVGYEGLYEVSSLGALRSLGRQMTTIDGRRRTYPPRQVRGWLAQTGYPMVTLSRDGVKRKFTIHTLVAIAFLGPRPTPKHVACHNDGTRDNNHLVNLRWATQSDNLRDAVRHGTHHWANKTHCPKGHAYSPENTYVSKAGRRACRACNGPRLAEYKRRQRREAKPALFGAAS
jgi:hypothetical protein